MLRTTYRKVASWLKSALFSTPTHGGGWGYRSSTIDSFRSRRQPTSEDLLREVKNTAYACAMINASTCASFPFRLFVKTSPGQAEPIAKTMKLDRIEKKRLHSVPWLRNMLTKADDIQEIVEHPVLELFKHVNPIMNSHDLLELTTFYQEIFGEAYWFIIRDNLGRPIEIWPIPTQFVYVPPIVNPADPTNLTAAFAPDHYDFYMYSGSMRVPAENVIVFLYPDPRNPFTRGLSPLRAAFEHVTLNSEFIAHKQALWENRARPDAIISPGEVIGQEERDRLEDELNEKFRRGGAGKILVAESSLSIAPLSWPLNETALIGEHDVTKEDTCNSFGVPVSYLTKDVNLSILDASGELYMTHTIRPRLNRRDQKITERLLPLYDPTGRLFVAAEDPVPEDLAAKREQERVDLEHGTVTINEVRAERGLPPVEWGHVPWLPTHFAPAPNSSPETQLDRTQRYGTNDAREQARKPRSTRRTTTR